MSMRVGLAICGVAVGVATWAILALWAPHVGIVYFLRTLEPRAQLSIAGVAIMIFATRLAAPLVSGQMQSRLTLLSVITPSIILGGYAAFVLVRIVRAAAAMPALPARIIAPNVADATLMISLALLCTAGSLGMHAGTLNRHHRPSSAP